MCGRYYVNDDTAKAIEALVGEISEKIRREQLGCDIHPTDTAPVLCGEAGSLQCVWQKWGFPGFGGKNVIFNARSETVTEKRMFREGVEHRRIIVPGTWFYEWNRNKEKHTFLRQDGRALFMAGFSHRFGDEDRFVILTTQANESMIPVHERMPLILEEGQLAEWVFHKESAKKILEQRPVLLKRQAEYEQQTMFPEHWN